MSYFYLSIAVASFFGMISLFHEKKTNNDKSVINPNTRLVLFCNFYMFLITLSIVLAYPNLLRYFNLVSTDFTSRESCGLIHASFTVDSIFSIFYLSSCFVLILIVTSILAIRFINFDVSRIIALAPYICSLFFIVVNCLVVQVYIQTNQLFVYFIVSTLVRFAYVGIIAFVAYKIEEEYGSAFD